ncbi:P12 domain protein, putative [Rhizoctonia solani AG-3 Rhs1AP]|uniref:p12 domain protein, putative n=1 Tax=Rhizoctonia solani AG-3 Rhs1AP TaxID=1086054 RepID=X8IWI0_9AGAM|nr:P12 domain protein, putative [Rhizoctonia solani AG-3 Rhs1AP]
MGTELHDARVCADCELVYRRSELNAFVQVLGYHFPTFPNEINLTSIIGRDVALDGDIKGNMSIQLLYDGIQAIWSPSEDTLFSLYGNPIDIYYQHNITLKVLDASSDARLSVVRARVNGSLFVNDYFPPDRWIVPSNEDRLRYSGFIQTASVSHVNSSTTHISTEAGSTVSMQFNGSTILVYGPCGPEYGLMRVTINGEQQMVNASKPFASDDCLLFQAWGLPSTYLHRLLIENVDGTLGINRI